jgi:hypothetical protein
MYELEGKKIIVCQNYAQFHLPKVCTCIQTRAKSIRSQWRRVYIDNVRISILLAENIIKTNVNNKKN